MWTPAQLSPLRAWWNAKDDSTLTETAGVVTQIDDKSGNDYHLSQGTGSKQPTLGTINSLQALQFDGVDDYLFRNDAMGFTGNPAIGIFMVIEFLISNPSVNQQRMVSFGHADGFDSAGAYNAFAASSTYGIFYGDGNRRFTVPTTGEPRILAFTRAAGETYDDGNMYKDGVDQAASSVSSPTEEISLQDGITIMSGVVASGVVTPSSKIAIGEMIITESECLTCRETIEGYLAWTWGLQASLPAGHPYKTDGSIFFPGGGGYGKYNYSSRGLGLGVSLGHGSAY